MKNYHIISTLMISYFTDIVIYKYVHYYVFI